MEVESEKEIFQSNIIWSLEDVSSSLENLVRAPQSLKIDENNRIYLGCQDGIYFINIKKIAHKQLVIENFLETTDLISKSLSEESFNIVLKKFNEKTRQGQIRNLTTTIMFENKLYTDNLIENKVLMKSFAISPNGLLPENETIIGILFINGIFMMVGKQKKGYLKSYSPISSYDLTGENLSDFPLLFDVKSFCWTPVESQNLKLVILSVIQSDKLTIWGFEYFNINSEKPVSFKKLKEIPLEENCENIQGIFKVRSLTLDIIYSNKSGAIFARIFSLSKNGDYILNQTKYQECKTQLSNIQFLSIVPPEFGDNEELKFIYYSQGIVNLGQFSEDTIQVSIYKHNFPSNVSEICYTEDDIEIFFIDGTDVYLIVESERKICKTVKGIYSIYGAAYTPTKLLKIVYGPPNYSALKTSNVVIQSNLSDRVHYDIIYQMSVRIHNRLNQCEGEGFAIYTLRNPLNFNDVLFIFAKNQINYKKFIKVYLEMYESASQQKIESKNGKSEKKISKNEKKKELQKLISEVYSNIIERLQLSEELQNHINGIILINLFCFERREYGESIERMIEMIEGAFYSNLIKWGLAQNDKVQKLLNIQHLKRYLGRRSGSTHDNETETKEICPICSSEIENFQNKCVKSNHLFKRCALSRKIIYLEKFYQCSCCKEVYDKESIKNLESHGILINFACIICANMLK